MAVLTQRRLKELLSYDRLTGVFTWSLVGRVGVKAGSIAGTLTSAGYIQIFVDGVRYAAHHLAWLYMKGVLPTGRLDHKDLDKANNRWRNLRPASRRQNAANIKAHKDSALGIKGVQQRGSRFAAKIYVSGRYYCLGTFDKATDASDAYVAAAKKFHGEYARG